jgi:hypothetical protein
MNSQVKGLVLLFLLNNSVVGSKIPSSLKTTKHKAFSLWHYINKLYKQRSTSLQYLPRYFHGLA